MKKNFYNDFTNILKEELIPALGCTEPIAIALAAAKAREVLGKMPDRLEALCSGHIIKNVKSVIVPNSGGMVGIEASVVLGVLGGDSTLSLEALRNVTEKQCKEAKKLIAKNICAVKHLKSPHLLHIIINASCGKDLASVEITDVHDNISKIEKNGSVIFEKKIDENKYRGILTDRSGLSVGNIIDFANNVELNGLKDIIEKQIQYNYAVAEEGLKGIYGLDIGNTLLKNNPSSIQNKMKAYTAAAVEARMEGCLLPVITNSGSGNLGLATSIPIIIYAEEKKFSREKLIRALIFANLLTIYQKTYIGRLSAFCSAVTAGCTMAATLAYLDTGKTEIISMAITNTLANTPGLICDGAKASCAAKKAASLDSGFLALSLAMNNKSYHAGSGILKESADKTIKSAGFLAAEGMLATNDIILDIMLKPCNFEFQMKK